MNYLAFDPTTHAPLGKRRDSVCESCGTPATVLVVFERFRKQGKAMLCRLCSAHPVGPSADSGEEGRL
jgi:hypothetical protein